MPKLFGGVAVVALGWLSGGCTAHRPTSTVVTPDYSYLRDGGRIAAVTDPTATRPSIEELAIPLEFDEDAWLTPPLPRGELVHVRDGATPE